MTCFGGLERMVRRNDDAVTATIIGGKLAFGRGHFSDGFGEKDRWLVLTSRRADARTKEQRGECARARPRPRLSLSLGMPKARRTGRETPRDGEPTHRGDD